MRNLFYNYWDKRYSHHPRFSFIYFFGKLFPYPLSLKFIAPKSIAPILIL